MNGRSSNSPQQDSSETMNTGTGESSREDTTTVTNSVLKAIWSIDQRLNIPLRRFDRIAIVTDELETALWLFPGLLAGGVIYFIYLFTHPYPAYGSGLFLLMAQEVSSHGYLLPATVPYFAQPVPFVYPPLMFYIIAALHDTTGVGPVAITRYLPGLVVILTLVPFYFFVQSLLESKRAAGIATIVLATSPPVLEWHISAGGVVRAPAMFFLCAGLYTGLLLFKTGKWKWLLPSVVLFSLTLLTHPVYTAFFVISYLWMYAIFDRSLGGLLKGAIVACGGLVLTAPWWTYVIAIHGPAVFTNAAGTHSGIGQQLPTLSLASDTRNVQAPTFGVLSWGLRMISTENVFITVWCGVIGIVAGYVGIVGSYCRSRTQVFLAGWFVLSLTLVSETRFTFLIGSILIAVAITDGLFGYLARLTPFRAYKSQFAYIVLFLLCITCLSVGSAYASSSLDSHSNGHTLPAFIDHSDVAAMQWVHENVSPSSKFVVLGDTAEWFPYFTHRHILVGPWGIEWKGDTAYQHQVNSYSTISTCKSKRCLENGFDAVNVHPQYIYLPKDDYTIRGKETRSSSTVWTELVHDRHYTLVYQNKGVAIFKTKSTATVAHYIGNRRVVR